MSMDGVSKIIDRISSETRDEVAKIEAEGAERAGEIQAEYRAAAKKDFDERTAEGAKNSAAGLERQKNAAELEAKKTLLAEKQALLAEVFALAAKRLAELPQAGYIQLLAELAANASRDGDEQLIFNADDKLRVGAAVVAAANKILAEQSRAAALTLSDGTRNIPGGVIISSGSVEVNASLNALVEQCKNELSPAVAAILFE